MKNKIGGILVAVVLTFPIVWVLFQYGPVPDGSTRRSKPNSVAAASEKNTAARPGGKNENSEFEVSSLMRFLGDSVGSGKVKVSPETHRDELIGRYRDKGYIEQREVAELIKNGKAAKEPLKVYWENCENNTCVISAVGNDANPFTTEEDEIVTQYSTVIQKKDEGVFWETYRLSNNRNFKEGDDLPGEDPALIPRLQGSQRIIGLRQPTGSLAIYQTGKTFRETTEWYSGELKKLQFKNVSDPSLDEKNLLLFSRDDRFCAIWLSSNKNGKTMIVVSMQN